LDKDASSRVVMNKTIKLFWRVSLILRHGKFSTNS
jgi:hypothetical protein